MGPKTKTTERLSIEGRWDGLGTIDRLKMILSHPDHFLNLGLVTREELERVMATSETEWEYILDRDPQTLFHNIDLSGKIFAQQLRAQLKTALMAVFLTDQKTPGLRTA